MSLATANPYSQALKNTYGTTEGKDKIDVL